jgi:hypothetical protein
VKAGLEDFGNMGITHHALSSNFPTEAIMKIVKITQFCLQEEEVLQPTMSDVMDEINDALQLEEGQKGEESPIKIEIPQYASQSETNPKGKRQQQLETSNAQSHGSRSVFQIVLIYHYITEGSFGQQFVLWDYVVTFCSPGTSPL